MIDSCQKFFDSRKSNFRYRSYYKISIRYLERKYLMAMIPLRHIKIDSGKFSSRYSTGDTISPTNCT